MSTTKEIVKKWTDSVEKDLLKNYKRLGLKASGDWGKSLEQKIKQDNKGISISILANDYTEYMQNGRRPNKNQSQEAIRAWVGWAGSTIIADWVKQKGLKINPFAVAYKIATEGIDVPNKYNKGGLVSDVVTKERIDELNKSLTLFYISDFQSTIIKNLKI